MRPPDWVGMFTWRPSAVTTTATGRRSRPLLKPTVAVSDALAAARPKAVRSGQSSMPARSRNHSHRPSPLRALEGLLPGCSAAPVRRATPAPSLGSPARAGCVRLGCSPLRCAGPPRRLRSGVLLTNERTVELDGPFSSTVAAYPPRSLPAVTRRKDVGDAGEQGDRGKHPQSLKPDEGPHVAHHQKSQRMPAPSVRAMDATSARTQVKRTRLVFTSDSVRRSFTLEPATGRSSRWKDPWLCVPTSRRVCPGRYRKRRTFVLTTKGT